MYFAISKIRFESENSIDIDYRDISALATKLRSKFRICVEVSSTFGEDGIPVIVIAMLGKTENGLSVQLDRILEFCEESGFGRVESERTLLDHVDTI